MQFRPSITTDRDSCVKNLVEDFVNLEPPPIIDCALLRSTEAEEAEGVWRSFWGKR